MPQLQIIFRRPNLYNKICHTLQKRSEIFVVLTYLWKSFTFFSFFLSFYFPTSVCTMLNAIHIVRISMQHTWGNNTRFIFKKPIKVALISLGDFVKKLFNFFEVPTWAACRHGFPRKSAIEEDKKLQLTSKTCGKLYRNLIASCWSEIKAGRVRASFVSRRYLYGQRRTSTVNVFVVWFLSNTLTLF